MPVSLARAPEFEAVYRAHHGFVGRTLLHLGVEASRVDDAAQDVFLVVHRRLAEFAGRAAVRTWLFEIARRVASRYRRSAARQAGREAPLPVEVAAPASPTLERAEALAIVARLLAELDRDQALVFVFAELEQWRAPEIAEELGVNLNTVYSRLRSARRELDRLVRRIDARDRRIRSGAAVLACLGLAGTRVPDAVVAAGAKAGLQGMFNKTWLVGPVLKTTAVGVGSGPVIVGVGVVALVAFMAGGSAPVEAGSAQEPTPVVASEAPSRAAAAHGGEAAGLEVVATPVVATPVMARPKPRRDRDSDTLAAELASFEALRAAAQAHDDRAVLNQVARHQRRYRDGVFAQESAALAIEARCRLGEREQARREAEAFLGRWPQSTLAARVAALCPA